MSLTIEERAKKIAMIALDVDGVLTDGRLVFTDEGREIKRFHVRDGHGIKMVKLAGLPIVAISGRRSRVTAMRLAEWGFDEVHQRVREKIEKMDSMLEARQLSWDRLAYMGDDVLDLRIMKKCGLALAPADAVEEVKRTAHWISTLPGGAGCVREAVEVILGARGDWDRLMENYR